jgi:hypothetical protein
MFCKRTKNLLTSDISQVVLLYTNSISVQDLIYNFYGCLASTQTLSLIILSYKVWLRDERKDEAGKNFEQKRDPDKNTFTY